jgi:hypothetical protein
MKTYIPTADMRTNPLSAQPGGSTVTVKYESHEIVYTNIKNTKAYISKIRRERDDIVAIYVDDKLQK